MAKKTVAESDETRLKKKISTKRADTAAEGSDALRSLRKRLKREQRRRRALALRKKHAGSAKSEAAASA